MWRDLQVFDAWNKTELESYLIEITSQILRFRDPLHPNDFLIDKILDAAGQVLCTVHCTVLYVYAHQYCHTALHSSTCTLFLYVFGSDHSPISTSE